MEISDTWKVPDVIFRDASQDGRPYEKRRGPAVGNSKTPSRIVYCAKLTTVAGIGLHISSCLSYALKCCQH
jgi:hypothetical protein